MDQRTFNNLIKFSNLNDDPKDILGSIYNNELPHPYFDPAHIAFRQLRNFNHGVWHSREKSNRTIVFKDLEFFNPIDTLHWNVNKDLPCLEHDKLILSCITHRFQWPCETVFNSWHLVQTCMANENTFVESKTSRPYFADILLGNLKQMRQTFFDLLQQNNQLENNLVNAFGQYKTPYLDEGTGEIDLFFKQFNDNANTTVKFKGFFCSQFVSKYIQESSWYSVVAETMHGNDVFFPTEKTGKALLSNKPFIVLGSQYFLKSLKNIGFKTFSPIIDESYDEISNAQERTKAAFQSFIELQKQDPIFVRQQLQNVLDHNEKCMRDKEWLSRNARAMLDPLTTNV